ncbi:MAG: hypothetical protein LBD58_09060, partial [Treponema sp.]|nr:hypothetical protein [Treponema sp.]
PAVVGEMPLQLLQRKVAEPRRGGIEADHRHAAPFGQGVLNGPRNLRYALVKGQSVRLRGLRRLRDVFLQRQTARLRGAFPRSLTRRAPQTSPPREPPERIFSSSSHPLILVGVTTPCPTSVIHNETRLTQGASRVSLAFLWIY